jgi:hypothetical protein
MFLPRLPDRGWCKSRASCSLNLVKPLDARVLVRVLQNAVRASRNQRKKLKQQFRRDCTGAQRKP